MTWCNYTIVNIKRWGTYLEGCVWSWGLRPGLSLWKQSIWKQGGGHSHFFPICDFIFSTSLKVSIVRRPRESWEEVALFNGSGIRMWSLLIQWHSSCQSRPFCRQKTEWGDVLELHPVLRPLSLQTIWKFIIKWIFLLCLVKIKTEAQLHVSVIYMYPVWLQPIYSFIWHS